MYPLKQSAVLDVIFFAHDANGDAVTGKVNGDFTKLLSKNGGSLGAMTVTITERANGFYHLQLSGAHTDTLGLLTVVLTASGIKQVNLQWRVEARLPEDLAYPAVTGRSFEVDTSGQVTVGTIAANAVSIASIQDGAIDAGAIAADAITAAKIAAGAIDSAELSAAACNKIADHILRRVYGTARVSGDGDTLNKRTLLGLLAFFANKWAVDAGNTEVDIYHEDDTTVFYSKEYATTPTADPITSLTPNP